MAPKVNFNTDKEISQENTSYKNEDVKMEVELIDFEKAFRIYKRDHEESKEWNEEAVKIFTRKQINNALQIKHEILPVLPQTEWNKYFSKY